MAWLVKTTVLSRWWVQSISWWFSMYRATRLSLVSATNAASVTVILSELVWPCAARRACMVIARDDSMPSGPTIVKSSAKTCSTRSRVSIVPKK